MLRLARGALFFLFLTCLVSPAGADDKPAASKPIDRAKVKVLFEEGATLMKEERFEEAKQAFGAVLAADPGFAPAYFYLGLIRFRRGDVREAARYMQHSVDLGAKNPKIYFMLGVALAADGMLDRAEKAYSESVKLDPRQMNAYHELALIYFRQNKYDKAAETFKKALEIDPRSSKSMLMAGMAYLKMEKPENAIEFVSGLRGVNEEKKAVHLENLIREVQAKRKIPDPDAQLLRPEAAPAPPQAKGPRSKAKGKMSVTGTAQVNIKGAETPTPDADPQVNDTNRIYSPSN